MNVFMGTYWEVLKVQHETIGLDLVIAEDKPTSSNVIELAQQLGTNLEVISASIPLAQVIPDTCEVAVVGSFGRILPQAIIDNCQSVVNFHPGIVQEIRGRHTIPVNARRGDAFMGITSHLIENEQIDAGPILAQIRIPIDYDANFDRNHLRLRSYLGTMALDIFKAYMATGRFVGVPWVPTPESYHRPLTPKELHEVLDAERLADCILGSKNSP